MSPDYNFRDFVVNGTYNVMNSSGDWDVSCAACYIDELWKHMEWPIRPEDLTSKLERGKIVDITPAYKEGR